MIEDMYINQKRILRTDHKEIGPLLNLLGAGILLNSLVQDGRNEMIIGTTRIEFEMKTL